MRTPIVKAILILSLMLFFLQCKKTADTTSLAISVINGYVQKGPFSSGTQVLMYELKRNLSQTGKIFTTTITDNRGSFQIKDINLISDYVLLSANGFYFNEVLGSVSPAQIQLFALADIKDAASINVNLLTHLEKRRVEYLVSQGKDFQLAKKTAQTEILNVFGISNVTLRESEKLDISFAGEDNAVLLAISVMLQGNLSVGELSELLSSIASDMEKDGTLDAANIKSTIQNNAFTLNVKQIRQNLTKRYQDLGLTATIPDFEKYIWAYITQNVKLPTLTTTAVTDITVGSLKTGGTITSNGGASIQARGVVWSETPSPTIDLTTKTTDSIGDGTFVSNIPNLNPKTKYYIRAYATNVVGTAYGNELEITTSDVDIMTGLVAYYPFNGNANDESGNGNHGTVNGAVLTIDRNKVSNSSYYFDGISWIDFGNLNYISTGVPNEYTISIWAYPTAITSYSETNAGSLILGDEIYQNNGVLLSLHNIHGFGAYTAGSQNFTGYCNCIPNINEWINYTVTQKSTGIDLYINGNLWGHLTDVLNSETSEVTRIGYFFQFQTRGFIGKLDDIRIYNRALTQEQITNLATH